MLNVLDWSLFLAKGSKVKGEVALFYKEMREGEIYYSG